MVGEGLLAPTKLAGWALEVWNCVIRNMRPEDLWVCLAGLVLVAFNKKLFVADLVVVADLVEMRTFHLDYFRVIE